MKTIIIIVGVARSGSTLLAKAIGGHSKCFTLGEVNRFNDEINNSETQCGCAEKLSECIFWNKVLDKLKNKLNSNIEIKEGIFQIGIFNQLTKSKIHKLISTVLFNKSYDSKIVNIEIENTYKLYNLLFKETNSGVLIDSSKNLFRALVLASRAKKDIQFRFIHLTRDGRGVLNSNLKSSYSVINKDGTSQIYEGITDKKPIKIINNWLYINIRNFMILYLFNRKKTIFIRYEDFTDNPSKYLKQIYKEVNLDYEEAVLNLGGNENHILGGNASRINAKKIRKQDEDWKKRMDKKMIKKFNNRAGLFNIILGYK